MAGPSYALVNGLMLKRLPLADLRRLCDELPEQFRPPELVVMGRVKAPLVAAIEAARSAYWNAQPAPSWHARKPRDCEIPAAEVNAFLRSLPPMPPAGGWPNA